MLESETTDRWMDASLSPPVDTVVEWAKVCVACLG